MAGAFGERLLRAHHARLIAVICAGRANAGDHKHEIGAAGLAQHLDFTGGTDNAVQSGFPGQQGHIAHALLQACRGELTEVRITFKNTGEHSLTINGMDAGFTGRSARIFTDRTFNEVYVDGGREYWVRTLPAGEFDARATDIASGAVETLEIHRLKSIWKGE